MHVILLSQQTFDTALTKNGQKRTKDIKAEQTTVRHRHLHKAGRKSDLNNIVNECNPQRVNLIHEYNEVNIIRLIIHRRLGFFLCVCVCGPLRRRLGIGSARKSLAEAGEASDVMKTELDFILS